MLDVDFGIYRAVPKGFVSFNIFCFFPKKLDNGRKGTEIYDSIQNMVSKFVHMFLQKKLILLFGG